MLDIVKLSEDLRAKLQQETDILMSDRLMTREVLENRARELESKCNDELRRVDEWSQQQKALISEIFSALISEIEADRRRNEANLAHMRGDGSAPAAVAAKVAPRPATRHLNAAE